MRADRLVATLSLQAAVVQRRKVKLGYVNRARGRTERLVDPLSLVDKDDIWYLIAETEGGPSAWTG